MNKLSNASPAQTWRPALAASSDSLKNLWQRACAKKNAKIQTRILILVRHGHETSRVTLHGVKVAIVAVQISFSPKRFLENRMRLITSLNGVKT